MPSYSSDLYAVVFFIRDPSFCFVWDNVLLRLAGTAILSRAS